MKKTIKKLLFIFEILVCILLILIGLIGIYVKDGNIYRNLISDYSFASDLKGITIIEFKPCEEENSTENLNIDNYNESLKIMKKRLNFLETDEYSLDLDKTTGNIVLKVEDEYITDIESLLPMVANVQIKKIDDTILDYSDYSSLEAMYVSLEEGYTTYIDMKLKNTGLEKINKLFEEKKLSDEENSEETTESETLTLYFDEEEITEFEYEDIKIIGKKTLRITTKENLTTDSEIQSEINTNTVVSKMASFGKMPVKYEISANEYINSNNTELKYIVYIFIIISIIISIIYIVKYKCKGVIGIFSFLTIISVFLILIRLTNISISLNSFAGIAGLILLNSIILKNIITISNQDKYKISDIIKKSYLKSIDYIFVAIIILVIFSFSKMTIINTTGLLMFWGVFAIILGNIVFTVPMIHLGSKE